jgi:hypothetical protein
MIVKETLMRNRCVSLQVEELESRVALSRTTPAPLPFVISPEPLVPLALHQQQQHATLQGVLRGMYTVTRPFPDAGTDYDLTGTGRVHGLGQVTVAGSLHSTGFILHGHAGGTLTLQNDQGSVTLQLVGPTQRGFAPLPHRFNFTVVDATGGYQGLSASGTIRLNLHPDTGTFTLHVMPNSLSLA